MNKVIMKNSIPHKKIKKIKKSCKKRKTCKKRKGKKVKGNKHRRTKKWVKL